MAVLKFIDRAQDQSYWQRLNPDLKICAAPGPYATPVQIDQNVIDDAKNDISTQGYLQIPSLLPAEHVARLAKAMETIVAAGWPTAFAFMYDNFWEIYQALAPVISGVLGPDYIHSPQIWAWYVKPDSASTGWTGHRDRPQVDSLFPDGTPKIMNIWVPLTDATPLNGCMYVLPAHLDPRYNQPVTDFDVPNLQDVRALPAVRGSMLAWSEKLFHWGSRSSNKAHEPRISVANCFQRRDQPLFDVPALDAKNLISFEQRLGLISQNILCHHHRYCYHEEIVPMCEKLSTKFPPMQFLNMRKQETFDSDRSVSKSMIWSLQERYFSSHNPPSWHETDAAASINRHTHIDYAELLSAFLDDIFDKLDLDAPLYIVEIGSGTGDFAERLLEEIFQQLKDFERLRTLKIRYVLTDFSPSIVKSWRAKPKLSGYMRKGVVDSAVFNAEKDREICLIDSGSVLKGQNKNPILFIANSVFSSMKQDVFRFGKGEVEEVRWYSFRDATSYPPELPVELNQIDFIERYFEVDTAHYGYPTFDSVLQDYSRILDQARVLMPIGALHCVDNLGKISDHNFVLLSSDYGHGQASAGIGWSDRTLPAQHQGWFSFPVNFDAIARCIKNLGGICITEQNEGSDNCLQVGAVLRDKGEKVEHLRNRAHIVSSRSGDSSFAGLSDLLTNIEPTGETRFGWTKLFILIMRSHDFTDNALTVAWSKTSRQMLNELPALDAQTKGFLIQTLHKSESNIARVDDALIWLMECYRAAECFEECFRLGGKMLELHGSHRELFDQLALCSESTGQYEKAHEFFAKSVELNPDHDWARTGMVRMRELIGSSALQPTSKK